MLNLTDIDILNPSLVLIGYTYASTGLFHGGMLLIIVANGLLTV